MPGIRFLPVHVNEDRTLRNFHAAARAVHPELSLKGSADRLLYLLRCAFCYPQARAWHAWLQEPLMAPAVRANPMLWRKIVRPYVSPWWTKVQTLQVMKGHFEFVAERLNRGAFLESCTPGGLILFKFTGHRGKELRVRWVNDPKFSKEGELSLVLDYGEDRVLASSITGVILRVGSSTRCTLVIGGTQGPDIGTDKDIIRDIAKELHGLRPKALLLFALQQVAQVWQLERILATGNRAHISRHIDYALNRRRRPTLTYDEFWQESGGRRRADGYYDLPLDYIRRSGAEIKPNKRSLYKLRYEMLDRISGVIRDRLSECAEHRVPSDDPRGNDGASRGHSG